MFILDNFLGGNLRESIFCEKGDPGFDSGHFDPGGCFKHSCYRCRKTGVTGNERVLKRVQRHHLAYQYKGKNDCPDL